MKSKSVVAFIKVSFYGGLVGTMIGGPIFAQKTMRELNELRDRCEVLERGLALKDVYIPPPPWEPIHPRAIPPAAERGGKIPNPFAPQEIAGR